MSTSKSSIIVPAVAGIIAGVASSLLLSFRDHRAQADPVAPPPTAQAPEQGLIPLYVAPGQDPVEEVQKKRAAPLDSSNAAPRPPSPPADEVATMEQHKREVEQRHEQAIRTHRAQPIDPAWARKTNAMLQSDLTELAASSSFKLIEADCRTTSCIATVEWPSYGKAMVEWRRLLHHGYQANCSREITLPDAQDPQGAYQATIVLDCEKWRGEGN
jgi:hypothetical protein